MEEITALFIGFGIGFIAMVVLGMILINYEEFSRKRKIKRIWKGKYK